MTAWEYTAEVCQCVVSFPLCHWTRGKLTATYRRRPTYFLQCCKSVATAVQKKKQHISLALLKHPVTKARGQSLTVTAFYLATAGKPAFPVFCPNLSGTSFCRIITALHRHPRSSSSVPRPSCFVAHARTYNLSDTSLTWCRIDDAN